MSFIENSKPPPPPPLPLQQSTLSSLKIKKQTHDEASRLAEEELNVTIERLLSLNEKFNGIFYKKNTFLKPQLQEGPKCGLVALSIASSINEIMTNVDDILKEAVLHNFTKQGEIFDSSYLAFLAEQCCGFKPLIVEGGLHLHLHCIISSLLMKGLLLVPYDADYNHSPCLKNGSKAHWAVITGFAIFESSDSDKPKENVHSSQNMIDNNIIEINLENCSLCNCIESCRSSISNINLSFLNHKGKILIGKKPFGNVESYNNFKKGELYLIGMQGKSKHIGLWSFSDITASNDNLLYFSSDRDSEEYVLPEGGLVKGLKGKAIILY